MPIGWASGTVRREARQVALTGSEQHLDHIGLPGIDVVLGEGESVAHGEHVVEGYGVARVIGIVPLRDRRGVVEAQAPVTQQDAHRCVQDRFRHGPREQRRVGLDGLVGSVPVLQLAAVSLGQETTALHHSHREGRAVAIDVGRDVVEQPVEPRCNSGRGLSAGPVARRPRHALGLLGQRDEVFGRLRRGCGGFRCDAPTLDRLPARRDDHGEERRSPASWATRRGGAARGRPGRAARHGPAGW